MIDRVKCSKCGQKVPPNHVCFPIHYSPEIKCMKCREGTPHTVSKCTDPQHPEAINALPVDGSNLVDCGLCAERHPEGRCTRYPEGPGVITRIDRYTLSVNGHHLRATEDQERRIRALSPEQRHDLLVILGKIDQPFADPDEVTAYATYKCSECNAIFPNIESRNDHSGCKHPEVSGNADITVAMDPSVVQVERGGLTLTDFRNHMRRGVKNQTIM